MTAKLGGDFTPLIEIQGISKRFPGVVANDDLWLTICGGEIHTILGENGAGKSTLMNILAGMLRPDQGRLRINGREVTLESPQAALRHGIGTVYQHFTLVPNLSVIENVILGLDLGFALNLGRAEQRLKSLWGDFGLVVSPRTEVRYLSLGQQQRVEIIKTLFRGSQVLLLDEPTSVLTPPEVQELFAILSQLKTRGIGIVFITHKLDEALDISDRITILREGKKVGAFGPDDLAQRERGVLTGQIVAAMFGGPAPAHLAGAGRSLQKLGPPLCTLSQITALDDRGAPAVQGVSLQLQAGEIFGIAGVDGNGQKELGEVLAGQRPVIQGQVMLAGVNLTNRGVTAAAQAGSGYVTDDRLGEASVPSLSVAENAVLKVFNQPPFSRWTVLNRAVIASHTRRLIRQFKIKTPGPEARLSTLSGGNIQKLLLARELARQPKLLICNKPTQGLDALTAESILQTLRLQADQGMAVLLISSELDEILEVSDRIGVMVKGRLVGVVSRGEASLEKLGRLMLGLPDA